MKVQVKVRPHKSGKTSHRRKEEKDREERGFREWIKLLGGKRRRKIENIKEFKDWQSENTI